MPKISSDLRPKAFAGVELFLDICYAARTLADIDLESLLIYFCIVEATMRPLVLGSHGTADLMTVSRPPEDFRGSISMSSVADKLGMPRETVRRKIKAMIRRGLLVQDEGGSVRSPPEFNRSAVRKTADATYLAVSRYLSRMREFGLPEPQAVPRSSKGD